MGDANQAHHRNVLEKAVELAWLRRNGTDGPVDRFHPYEILVVEDAYGYEWEISRIGSNWCWVDCSDRNQQHLVEGPWSERPPVPESVIDSILGAEVGQ